MGYKTIIISNEYDLFLRNNRLFLDNVDKTNIPLEDIDTIVLEDQKIKITNKLLSKIAENNIAAFTCNDKHVPVGVFIPFNNHSRQGRIVKAQVNQSEPFKKRMWQSIVQQKLINQGKVLELLNIDGYNDLYTISRNVNSGDSNNREAYGAKIYFSKLFGKFTRDDECWINSSLNYGYTILRGAIARTISAYGFVPSLGVHHCNELNNFNLVDDIIEPFRPIVDLWTYMNSIGKSELSAEDRINLVNILNYNILVSSEKHSVSNAIDKVVSSLVSSYLKKDFSLLVVPEIIELNIHTYE